MIKNCLSEEKFVNAFLKNTDRNPFFSGEPVIFKQVEMACGIPDLLFVQKKQIKTLHDFMQRFPSINLTNGYARILSVLSKKGFLSFDSIIVRGGLTNSHFKKSIKTLEEISAVEKNKKGDYRLGKTFNLPDIKLLSLEFKLSNWRSALQQSLRYRTFSSHVSVVMPSNKRAVLVKNQESFRQFKIGAAVYNIKNKELEFIVKPIRCGALSGRLYVDALGRITLNNSFASSK